MASPLALLQASLCEVQSSLIRASPAATDRCMARRHTKCPTKSDARKMRPPDVVAHAYTLIDLLCMRQNAIFTLIAVECAAEQQRCAALQERKRARGCELADAKR